MTPNEDAEDNRHTKSRSNQKVQREGLRILLLDNRFQIVDKKTRQAIIDQIGGPGGYTAASFDLVMKKPGMPQITLQNVSTHLPALRLVEMKSTKKAIKDASLSKFFFGMTKNEVRLAQHLGDRFLFAFVVLSSENVFGRPFARLLTLDELKQRTKDWRTQFQVNFKSDLPTEGLVADNESIIVLGEPPTA